MFVEAFHRVFKHEYLKGKVNKRVDTCLLHLLKFVRDKAFERLIKLTKGKATSRIKTIQARHKASLTLPKESVRSEGEGVWKVQSEAEKTMYTVRRLQSECAVTDCVLKCHRCLKTCIHTFSCTCPDFLIQNTLCEHIHLVSASTQETPAELSSNMETPQHQKSPDVQDLFGMVRNEERNNLTSLKESIKERVLRMMTQVDARADENALEKLQKGLAANENLFKAMVSHPERPPVVTPQNRHPHNKRIETQRRFYSTEKKVKTSRRIRYARPSRAEKEEIFNKRGKFIKCNENQTKTIFIVGFHITCGSRG